jgi:hypothetical protein
MYYEQVRVPTHISAPLPELLVAHMQFFALEFVKRLNTKFRSVRIAMRRAMHDITADKHPKAKTDSKATVIISLPIAATFYPQQTYSSFLFVNNLRQSITIHGPWYY